MVIFLVILIFVSTFLHGMQLYTQSEQLFIDNYINHSFHMVSPKTFDVQTICGMYQSTNLKKNIRAIIEHMLNTSLPINIGQVAGEQKQKDYFTLSKRNEFVMMYEGFLESFVDFFPKMVKNITYHCTLPLSYAVQKKLLKKLWYGHWSLCLPFKVEKLYKEGIALQFIVGQQKELLNNFKLQCMESKSFSIDAKAISCYALCMKFAEKFLLLANELGRKKHTQVEDQEKLTLVCTNAAVLFQDLPSSMEPLRPWVAKFKKHTDREITRREIIMYFLEWWDSFWYCPHGKLNYKKNKIKDVDHYVQDKVKEYQKNVHGGL